jgi:hypothetical protein
VVDCFDIGIVNQLAVIKGCDLFISPHTGFAFAVVAVGTPWLTISGGPWAEYFYNGSLFYSVLPENKKYPCYKDGYNEKVIIDDGERVLSMCSARIQESLGEILDASEILISKKWTYDECLQAHFKKLTKLYDGDTSKINSFDNIHKSYF